MKKNKKSPVLEPVMEKIPEPPATEPPPEEQDPTKYGDWQKNGRCFDF